MTRKSPFSSFAPFFVYPQCYGNDKAKHQILRCILNKQYSRAEWETLAKKIAQHMQRTGEWGEFFPISVSAFGYNQTVAQELFPLDAAQVSMLGGQWFGAQDGGSAGGVPAAKHPASIAEIDDTVLDTPLLCASTGRAFKLNRLELNFYRRLGLPLPDLCPDARHLRRIAWRAPRNIWPRKCAKTGEPIWSTFSPNRPETVYSEDAFAAEMF